MGQIKNIKLLIVTDIKRKVMTTGKVKCEEMASHLLSRVMVPAMKRVGTRSTAHFTVGNRENRGWALTKSGKEMMEQEAHEYHHGQHTAGVWRNVSIYIGSAVFLVATVHSYFYEKDHFSHPRAEFVNWPHTRIRICGGWPWAGDQSFFHSRRSNALKEGYED